jgi:hypothetical protein
MGGRRRFARSDGRGGFAVLLSVLGSFLLIFQCGIRGRRHRCEQLEKDMVRDSRSQFIYK